jgi:hypothetical protein
LKEAWRSVAEAPDVRHHDLGGVPVTGLVFVLQPEGVVLGMDSLAVRAEDKSPIKYSSKFMGLPHLKAAICGTGSQRLPLEWYLDVQLNVLARDVDFINDIAPERLRDIWARLAEPGTATIYQFGFSPSEDAFVGTAFRSTSDFVAERLAYGIGIKPASEDLIPVAPGLLEELGYVSGIAELLARLRIADDALPLAERVGIGGEIHLLVLNDSGQYTHIADRWPDFNRQFDHMLSRLRADNAKPAAVESGAEPALPADDARCEQ